VRMTSVQSFAPKPEEVGPSTAAVAASHPDAILIAQGGVVLRSIAPTLALAGASNRNVKFLGTGLWDDNSIMREPMLAGGWFAAPSLEAERTFAEKYKSVYGAAPPRISSLGYDAVSLVALLSKGTPYQRYTPAALTDPNGFTGVDGIFRFHADGSAERGLAIMEVQPNGFVVVAPAPATFQASGS
jgi:branched-chain amino acid transport system substrate-binding protein